jgi:hydroxymethylbilane synthase
MLGGSCQVPLAAYASIQGGQMHVRALVAHPDGSELIRSEARGPAAAAAQLGEAAARGLLDKGAAAILAALQDPAPSA